MSGWGCLETLPLKLPTIEYKRLLNIWLLLWPFLSSRNTKKMQEVLSFHVIFSTNKSCLSGRNLEVGLVLES